MQALLSFDQAPPFSVPVRFMLTAPLFAVAAGLLLMFQGGDVMSTRWSPLTLALTHLFTAGFLLQVMLGALFQIMPVAVGANLWRPLWLARAVHGATALGAACLVAGFLTGRTAFHHVAGAGLGLGIGGFCVAAAVALLRVPNANPTALALKLALGGLLVTVSLGLALVAALVGGFGWPLRALTDLHAAWGLLAWCAMLLIGVSYVVVPMFQLTPGYPARFSRLFAPALLAAVLVWSPLRALDAGAAAGVLQWVLAGFVIAFAGKTLLLQRRSKRSRPDTTMRYWRLGLAAAVLGALSLMLLTVVGDDGPWSRLPLLVGVLALGGSLVSVISGMLYKILPFLSWLHLQNAAGLGGKVPHMGEYLPERFMHRQFVVHLVALVLLLGSVWQPEPLARFAGVALVVAQSLLLANILRVVWRYRAVRRNLGA